MNRVKIHRHDIRTTADETPVDVDMDQKTQTAVLEFSSMNALSRVLLRAPIIVKGTETKVSIFNPSSPDPDIEDIIEVTGIKPNVSEDALRLYFENTRRSDGGPVSKIAIDHTKHTAMVQFDDKAAAWRVAVRRRHQINGVKTRATFPETPVRMAVSLVDQSEYINIHVDKDRTHCHIDGSCPLPDGGHLIADYNNERLKRLDARGHLISHLHQPGRPHSVCYNESKGETAVSISNGRTIHFVICQEDDIVHTNRLIDIGYQETTIACYQDELYVANYKGESIKIFDWENGKNCGEIAPHDEEGEAILSDPCDLAVSEDGSRIFVADKEKGSVILNRDGTVIGIIKSFSMYPTGVCLGDRGCLFLCGWGDTDDDCISTCVIQCDRDGKKLRTIDGSLRQNPLSVSFNRRSFTLVVTMGADNIKVNHLK